MNYAEILESLFDLEVEEIAVPSLHESDAEEDIAVQAATVALAEHGDSPERVATMTDGSIAVVGRTHAMLANMTGIEVKAIVDAKRASTSGLNEGIKVGDDVRVRVDGGSYLGKVLKVAGTGKMQVRLYAVPGNGRATRWITTSDIVKESVQESIGELLYEDEQLDEETFKAAKDRLLAALDQDGWDVQGAGGFKALKVPHATDPTGKLRLYFKAQSVYMAQGKPFKLNDARSIESDIRGVTLADLLKSVKHFSESYDTLDALDEVAPMDKAVTPFVKKAGSKGTTAKEILAAIKKRDTWKVKGMTVADVQKVLDAGVKRGWFEKVGKDRYAIDVSGPLESISEGRPPRMVPGEFWAFATSGTTDDPDYYLFVTTVQKNGAARGIQYSVADNKSIKASFNGFNGSWKKISSKDIPGGAKANMARKLGGQSFEDFGMSESLDEAPSAKGKAFAVTIELENEGRSMEDKANACITKHGGGAAKWGDGKATVTFPNEAQARACIKRLEKVLGHDNFSYDLEEGVGTLVRQLAHHARGAKKLSPGVWSYRDHIIRASGDGRFQVEHGGEIRAMLRKTLTDAIVWIDRSLDEDLDEAKRDPKLIRAVNELSGTIARLKKGDRSDRHDAEALESVTDDLLRGDYATAASSASRLDTATRDMIPSYLWSVMRRAKSEDMDEASGPYSVFASSVEPDKGSDADKAMQSLAKQLSKAADGHMLRIGFGTQLGEGQITVHFASDPSATPNTNVAFLNDPYSLKIVLYGFDKSGTSMGDHRVYPAQRGRNAPKVARKNKGSLDACVKHIVRAVTNAAKLAGGATEDLDEAFVAGSGASAYIVAIRGLTMGSAGKAQKKAIQDTVKADMKKKDGFFIGYRNMGADAIAVEVRAGSDKGAENYVRKLLTDLGLTESITEVALVDTGFRQMTAKDLEPADQLMLGDECVTVESFKFTQGGDVRLRVSHDDREWDVLFARNETVTALPESLAEKSPPGFKGTVKAMKKKGDIDNPYALAWSMKKKGYTSHYKSDGTPKNESQDTNEELTAMLEEFEDLTEDEQAELLDETLIDELEDLVVEAATESGANRYVAKLEEMQDLLSEGEYEMAWDVAVEILEACDYIDEERLDELKRGFKFNAGARAKMARVRKKAKTGAQRQQLKARRKEARKAVNKMKRMRSYKKNRNRILRRRKQLGNSIEIDASIVSEMLEAGFTHAVMLEGDDEPTFCRTLESAEEIIEDEDGELIDLSEMQSYGGYKGQGRSEVASKIAAFLRKHPDVTYGELATTFKIGRDVAQAIMAQMGRFAGASASSGNFEQFIYGKLPQVGAVKLMQSDDTEFDLMEDELDEAVTKVESAVGLDFAPGGIAGRMANGDVIVFLRQHYDNNGNVDGPTVKIANVKKTPDAFTAMAVSHNKGFAFSKQKFDGLRKAATTAVTSLKRQVESLEDDFEDDFEDDLGESYWLVKRKKDGRVLDGTRWVPKDPGYGFKDKASAEKALRDEVIRGNIRRADAEIVSVDEDIDEMELGGDGKGNYGDKGTKSAPASLMGKGKKHPAGKEGKPKYQGQVGSIPDDHAKGEAQEDDDFDGDDIDERRADLSGSLRKSEPIPGAIHKRINDRAAKLTQMAFKFGKSPTDARGKLVSLAKSRGINYHGARDAADVARMIARDEMLSMREAEEILRQPISESDEGDNNVEVSVPREEAETLIEAAREAGLDSSTQVQMRNGRIYLTVPESTAEVINSRLGVTA